MHPLFRKVCELREARDEWAKIALAWEREYRAVQGYWDDARSALKVQEMLARTYLRERDKEREINTRLSRILGETILSKVRLRNAVKEVLRQDGDLLGDKSLKAINDALAQKTLS